MYNARVMAKRSAAAASGSIDASTRILVLHGKEAFLKKEHLDTLRTAIKDAHGDAEMFHFDGERATLAEVFDELRSYALMVSYKIVVVDQADEFVKNHREALERYAQNPVDHATLVLRSYTWNRGKLDALVAKVGALIKCEQLSPAEAKSWAIKRASQEHKVKLTPDAAAALVSRLGSHLMELDTELAKLALMVDKGGAIDLDLVNQTVGKGSDEQAWAVQEAVLDALGTPGPAAAGKAIEKIHEIIDLAGHPEVLVSYFVADLTRKLFLAHTMKRQGMPESQISRTLKLWPPERATLFMNAMRRFSPRQTAAMFDRMVRYDGRAKSGLGEPLRNLECFCAQLVDIS